MVFVDIILRLAGKPLALAIGGVHRMAQEMRLSQPIYFLTFISSLP